MTGYIICSILLFSTGTFAAEKTILTLELSVEMALERNPQITIAEKELSKSKASIWEAYAVLTPSINGSINFQKAWDIQQTTIPNFMKFMLKPQPGVLPPDLEAIFTTYTDAMPDLVQLSFGLENTFFYGATLTQPVFLGGAGIASVKIAYAAKRASEQHLESTKQNLIYQTANAFYGCLLAKEVIRVQEEALKQAEANRDIVTKKYEVGSASGFDKMRTEVEVANLQPAMIASRNNYQSVLTGLRTVIGLPKDTEIEIQGNLIYKTDDMKHITLDELQGLAFQKRPEVFALQAQKKIARSSVTIAGSQFMPKIFFQTDYSFMAMRNDNKFTQNDFSKGFTSALSLQMPLFNGFKNHKNYQKARLDYKIAKDTEKQALDGITAEVEITYNTYKESQEKYQAAEKSVNLAEEALRLANLMYEEGASTQLDVLNSQLALIRAKLNHISALYEYQMARYKIRLVSGTLKGIL
jgi:outer membrane protein TolC